MSAAGRRSVNSIQTCSGVTMSALRNFFSGSSRRTFILGGVLLFFVGYIDYVTGYEISVSYFYLAPVLLVGWNINLRAGLMFSLLAAVIWLFNDSLLVRHPYSQPLIPYWNTLVRLAFFATFTFLSDRVRALLERERAFSKMKSALIHTVSHEFNNSLTVFASGIFLLKETEPDTSDETRRKVLTALDETRGQMARYVKNILNEARMEAGKFRLERTVLALRELVNEAVLYLRGILETKGLKLEIEMPELPVLVSADRDALALVVSNLLANAVKYTANGGRIRVGISTRGEPVEKVIFSVEDTGIGIALADIDKITKDFYRTDAGKTAAGGFGLGLNITNELLALHGSRLEIFSEKGKGSRFSFELPAIAPSGVAEKELRLNV